jgi:hypothetical protein
MQPSPGEKLFGWLHVSNSSFIAFAGHVNRGCIQPARPSRNGLHLRFCRARLRSPFCTSGDRLCPRSKQPTNHTVSLGGVDAGQQTRPQYGSRCPRFRAAAWQNCCFCALHKQPNTAYVPAQLQQRQHLTGQALVSFGTCGYRSDK